MATFQSRALSGFGSVPSVPSVPSVRRSTFRSQSLAGLDGSAPEVPEAPEEPSFVSKALDFGKAAVNIGSAGVGGILAGQDDASRMFRGLVEKLPEPIRNVIPDPQAPFREAWERSAKENLAGRDPNKPLGFAESIALAPGGGRVLAEAIAPGTPTSAGGRIAKNIGGLVGDIATDPLTYVTGGLGAAAKAAKAGQIGTAGLRALASAPAGLVYAPELLSGVKESGGEALSKIGQGDFAGAVEPGVEAALLSGLGALMATGAVKDAGDLMRRFGKVSPNVNAPNVVEAPPTRLANALNQPQAEPATLDDFISQLRAENPRFEDVPPGALDASPDLSGPPAALPPEPLPFVRPEATPEAPAGILGDPNDPFVDPPVWNARYPNVLPDRTIGRTRVLSETPENYPAPPPSLLLPDGQRAMPTIHGPLIDDTQPFQRNPELEARQAEAMGANPEAAQAFVESAEGAAEAAARRMARKRGGPNAYEPPVRSNPLDEGVIPPADFAPPTGDPRLQNPNSMLGRVTRAEAAFKVGDQTPTDLRLVPDRRAEEVTAEPERRMGQERRAQIAQELQLDPSHPAVERLAAAEEATTAARTEADTDVLTGLGNRRAYETAAPSAKAAVSFDVAGLKWFNDTHGHTAGDSFLKTLGEAIREEPDVKAFRTGGDEFYLHAETPEAAEAAARNIQERLAQSKITYTQPDGSVVSWTGGRVDYGVGVRAGEANAGTSADAALLAGRARAEAAGERSPRGTRPQGLVDVPPSGRDVPNRPSPEVVEPLAPTGTEGPPVRENARNPFAERARLARAEADSLNQPTARERSMEQAFPLGAGFGHGSMRSRERGIDASVGRAVRAVEAEKNARYLEAQSAAFEQGDINAQGRSMSAEARVRSDKAAEGRERRGARIEAAREARGTKEPWEVRREVYADASGQLAGSGRRLVESDHAGYVEQALAQGKSVPPDVLADYPGLSATREKARTVETPDPNARWEAGEKNARPLVGRWNLANPHESLSPIVPTVAKASERLMAPLGRVVEAAARMAGESVNLKGLTLDSNIQAAVRGKDMRVGIMSAVEQATRKYESRLASGQYEGLNPKQRATMFNREVARHIVNPVSHEIAHAKADRMAKADKRVAKGLDAGGHGPAYVEALRDVYRRMSKGRDMLRRHIEQALDADGGKLRDSLQQAWAEVQPVWGRLDAERAGGRGVSTGDGGSVPVRPGSGSSEAPSGSGGVRGGRVGPAGGVRESPRGGGEAGDVAPGSGVRSGRAPIKPIPDKGNVTAHPEAPKPFTDKPAGFWDKVREFWKAGLVSAPGTQVANVVSAVGETGVRSVEAGLAGLVDRVMGGPRTRFSGEAVEQIKGSLSRAPAAFKAVADGLRTVASSEGAIGGKTGGIVRTPLQMLGVMDSGTAAMAEGAALRGRALRQAKSELPKGSRDQVAKRMHEIMAEPSDALKADVEAEVRNRQYRDAADDPESIVSSIKTLREKHKWLHAVLPFLETPGAIAKLTIERSPIGFKKGFEAYAKYKRAIKAGVPQADLLKFKGEAVDALAKPLAGTLALAMFGLYAKSGGMTGSGPTDPKEKALLRETGWQPYSFKVGIGKDSYYVPYGRFEPLSSFLGFAADMAEAKDTKTAGETFEKGLGSIVSNLTSKTYLQGLGDAAEFINDPKRFAGQYLANTAASAVPNIVKKAAQAIDPIQRDTKPSTPGWAGIPERIGKQIASGVPFASKTLPERKAVTGETVERPGNALSRLLSPVQATKARTDRDLEGLMAELSVSQGAPSRTVQIPKTKAKVRLSQSEYEYLQDVDKKASDYLRRQVKDTRFKRLAPEQQKAYIERVYRKAGDEARNRILQRSEFKTRARKAVQDSRANA